MARDEDNRVDDRIRRRRIAILSGLTAGAIVVLFGLAGVTLLVAEGLLFDGKPHYSEAWARCADGDECVAVTIPCGWTGVNRRHREDAERYYAYVATVIDLRCSIDEVPSEPPAATCRAGVCILE